MIILIGHGYVGSEIARSLNGDKFIHLNHKQFIENDIIGLDNKDTIVINAAGYVGSPNVDACEINKNDCMNGNIIWPLLLENKCGDNVPVIHIGSGCIYNSNPFVDPDYYYTEKDEPNFTFKENSSFYSGCKAFSEKTLSMYLDKSYILRIRIPFTKYDHPRNYLTKLKTYDKLVNVQNSISCLEDVADVVKFFIENRPKPGIYNCTNYGSITAYAITELMGIKKEWFESYDEFEKTIKARRSNCLLSTKKLQSIYKLRSVEDAIMEAVKND